MFCPYAVHRRIVTQTTFEHDENGNQIMQQTIEENKAEFLPCLLQECGAWRSVGRCQYSRIE